MACNFYRRRNHRHGVQWLTPAMATGIICALCTVGMNQITMARTMREVSELETQIAMFENASRQGASMQKVPFDILMTVTAYSVSAEEGTLDGITFSGLPADHGVVAADPAVIPIGSIVWVEGYGYALVADTGSAIKGNRLDAFLWDRDQAFEWGVRECKVRVLSTPDI